MNIINLNHFEINPDVVLVIGNSTVFSDETRRSIQSPQETLALFKELTKDAGGLGIKIVNKKTTSDKLNQLLTSAPDKIIEYNTLFDQCVSFWSEFCHCEGSQLHYQSYSDFDAGYELRDKIRFMFHRSQALRELCDIQINLKKLSMIIKQNSTSNFYF